MATVVTDVVTIVAALHCIALHDRPFTQFSQLTCSGQLKPTPLLAGATKEMRRRWIRQSCIISSVRFLLQAAPRTFDEGEFRSMIASVVAANIPKLKGEEVRTTPPDPTPAARRPLPAAS